MRILVGLLSHFCQNRQRKMTLIVSTTGDTGPAAVQAVVDMNHNIDTSSDAKKTPILSILVHFPQGQISNFQRRQMTTVLSPRVKVVAFQGGGDDMDIPIKRILSGWPGQQNADHLLCGVNSYNIARPLMQAVHFVSRFWS
jgi:threonine synthase